MDSENQKILFVSRDSDEWKYMWNKLAENEINKGLKEPTRALNFGERWQYMETYVFDGELKHNFRHRNHPNVHDLRHYLRIPVSDNFNPDIHCD